MLSESQRKSLASQVEEYAAAVDEVAPYLVGRGLSKQTAHTFRPDCDPCDERWSGAWRNGRPYVSHAGDGRAMSGARWIYMKAHGLSREDMLGLVVRHLCHNGRCVSVSHLAIGTQRDNVHDDVRAGKHQHGESHGMHRLTEQQVREIRRDYVPGTSRWAPGNRRELEQKYGVGRSIIIDIVNRKKWAHVV